MTGTLYLDVYFMVNFAVDCLLLHMVRKILKLPARPVRLILGGGAGALWACGLVLVPVLPGWAEAAATWILVGGLMTVLAFGKMEPSAFGRAVCTLWLVSAAAGGVIGAFADHVQTRQYLSGPMIPAQMTVMSLLCWMAGIYFGICACVSFIRARRKERENLYEVTLYYQGRKKCVTALLDTGNQLYEPYGHEPVHVITSDACRGLCETVSGVAYIPFSAVGTGHGVMPGFRVDEMEVKQDGKMVRVIDRPWLAISREPLSCAHRYEMLLHGEEQK